MGEVTFDLFAASAYIKQELGHCDFELTIYPMPSSTHVTGYRIVIRDFSEDIKGFSFVVTTQEIISCIPDMLNLRLEDAVRHLKG